MAIQKGKLIVIDGSDGVGKATQTKLLVERLKKEGKKVVTFDFPRYKQNFFGAFIRTCLDGERGDFVHIDPYIASVLYAADRFESKKLITDAINMGKTVVLDRYVSANQMHQGGKIKDAKKRQAFLKWLGEMEYSVFGIPRPNVIVYLHLPVALSTKLMSGRGVRDQHEGDIEHLENAQKSALKIIQSGGNWHKVVCNNKDTILSREEIHARIWDVLKKARSV